VVDDVSIFCSSCNQPGLNVGLVCKLDEEPLLGGDRRIIKKIGISVSGFDVCLTNAGG
jgi:hypothetical protein